MKPVNLLLGIHNHQPVGNFGHVFEESFETCYGPQIEVLKSHPGVKMALHHSGPLFEWIEVNRPGYIDDLGALAETGQIELLTGGFYEPILASLPPEDAVGQIVMMNEYIVKRFGQTPTGMWTAERIWDTELPNLARAAGVSYTLLDDTHFYYAGLGPDDMFGYWITEKHGDTLAVFPIDKQLRYAIPFQMPADNIGYLRSLRDQGVTGVTYGDDGEKFGVWPDTYEWVYEKKWLHNYYAALEQSGDIVVTTLFADFIKSHPPNGRVYLPLASYEEMGEWSLPPAAGAAFHEIVATLEGEGKKEEFKPYIRGGLWYNFLSKYDESNRMHKKMLHVSRKVKAAAPSLSDEELAEARQNLYRGQCNCSYWHGLFGGLYLNYLRHAVYEGLIKAELIAEGAFGDSPSVEKFDYDTDGGDDLALANETLMAVIDPDYGGSVIELDFRPAAFCLSNTLTRRQEAYHEKVKAHSGGGEAGGKPASIHDIVRVKEEGLHDHLVYDKADRRLFQDFFLDDDVTPERFSQAEFDDRGDFVTGHFGIADHGIDEGAPFAEISRSGLVDNVAVGMVKRFSLEKNRLQVGYTLVNESQAPFTGRLAVELNMTLLAGDHHERHWIGPGISDAPPLRSSGVTKGWIGMKDEWAGFEVKVSGPGQAEVWRYPVETVSQSEAGFERTYQGSAMVLVQSLSLQPGETARFGLTVEVTSTR